MDGVLSIAHDDKAFSSQGEQKVIAGARDARCVVGELPLSLPENPQIFRKDARVRVENPWEAPSVLDFGGIIGLA
jgi:hypothetical protein